jgi:hypothetical protein
MGAVKTSDEELPVIAIVAAYNEADVIAQTVGDLVAQGVAVYLIDHGSTDDTVDQARPLLGRGLLEIERLPVSDRFDWAALLRRKEQLAASLPGRWFLHADADELRESPWAGVSLKDGIALVERLGYDAIDFAVFDFRPLVGAPPFERGRPLREAFTHYEPGASFDRLQIKGWRQPPGGVELASSGGHDVRFAGRRVFPLRFLLRHYSIRSQAHGERKVFHERKGRFLDEERARGWHVQYDAHAPGASFVRDPDTLTRFDADEARLQLALHHRGVDALEASLAERELALADARAQHAALAETVRTREATIRALEAERDTLAAELVALRAAHATELSSLRAAHATELSSLHAAHTQTLAERERALADVEARLDAFLASRTWRWAAPARLAWRALGRR